MVQFKYKISKNMFKNLKKKLTLNTYKLTNFVYHLKNINYKLHL